MMQYIGLFCNATMKFFLLWFAHGSQIICSGNDIDDEQKFKKLSILVSKKGRQKRFPNSGKIADGICELLFI